MFSTMDIGVLDILHCLQIFSLFTSASTCGLSTHIEIGHIAATWFQDSSDGGNINFNKLIEKHQDAFQAGNTYPDSYYSSVCFQGRYHQVSEDTHWTPFTNLTIEYIRKTYPPPWNEETEKLIVFLLGFVSHQVADITWHSLGIRQGFIRTMAAADFHGVYDTSHSVADFGGDVVNLFRKDYSYVSYKQWYIPVKDLYEIYKLYYGTDNKMTEEIIEDCTSLMFLAVLGEKLAVSKLYPHSAVQSPFLTQQLESFFLGGMQDMALWTIRIWYNVINMIEKGFRNCSTPENPLYIRCNITKLDGLVNAETHTREADRPRMYKNLLKWPLEAAMYYRTQNHSVIKARTKTGLVLRPNSKTLRRIEALVQRRYTKNEVNLDGDDLLLTTAQPYAGLGRIVLTKDVNGDGLDDLVISAPMYKSSVTSRCYSDYQGAVFILYGSSRGFPSGKVSIEALANQTISGPSCTTGRFGEAIALVDLNKDGYIDLVVTSPRKGWKILRYQGCVDVFYGSASGRFEINSVSLPTDQKLLYDNAGMTLTSGDVNLDGYDDLLIGSPMAPTSAGPQSGTVCIILSKKYGDYKPYKCIHGPGIAANTSWFGSNILVTRASQIGQILVVGAPLYRKCILESCLFNMNDTQSVGQVTIWSLPELRLIREYHGFIEHGHFGSSLAASVNSDLLAVGANSIDAVGSIGGVATVINQAGSVHLFKLSLINGSSFTPYSILYGDRRFSMFGSQTQFFDLDKNGKDELLVSAPHYTDDPTEEIYGAEQGRVFVFSTIPTEDVGDICGSSVVQPCPNQLASTVIQLRENRAHLGTSMAYYRTPNNSTNYLVLAALSSSAGSRQSGSVLLHRTW